MSEQAQVGDTVRLTIEGKVYGSLAGWLMVDDTRLRPNHTVEILSRATPPLPSEPGTFWLDCNDDPWRVDSCGALLSFKEDNMFVARHYAPFRQLVLK